MFIHFRHLILYRGSKHAYSKTASPLRVSNFVFFVDIVRDLPPPNKTLLDHLLGLLTYIEASSSVNYMTASNLAIVFAPLLIRSPADMDKQTFSEIAEPKINTVVREMIKNHDKLTTVLRTIS